MYDLGTSAFALGTSAHALGTAKQRDKEEHKASTAKGGEATGTKKLTAEEKKQKILAEDPRASCPQLAPALPWRDCCRRLGCSA